MKPHALLFVILCSMFLPSIGSAQPRGNRVEMQVQRIKEKVVLTDEQTVKVKAILQKAQEEIRVQFENNEDDREARREMMMKRMEKSDVQILKLLTSEQKQRYEEYKKERQKEMQERMRERQ